MRVGRCIDGYTIGILYRFEWPFQLRLGVAAAELDDDRLAHLVRVRGSGEGDEQDEGWGLG